VIVLTVILIMGWKEVCERYMVIGTDGGKLVYWTSSSSSRGEADEDECYC
jgi:hypothetical protein